MYAVGIDIGTTHSAAAVLRDGRAEIVSLGSRSAAIPSAVFVRPDGSFVTGEAAVRRGLSEPDRVAREFKRRLGETAPILLGGTPNSATALMARMLRSLVDEVSARAGGPPASICVTHPASWGPYKIDLMHQVVRLADLRQPVRFTTEAQAAADFHAHRKGLKPGAVVAVYDLGGGTFDAAVLRKTSDGFDLIGQPEGGGVDIDDAIFTHVAASVGDALERPDKNDPALIAAVARLRAECVPAKEALSVDTDTAIPVLLPTVRTEVRLTRSELEEIVRPALHESIEALRRTIRSAGYAPQALGSVLLVGGSSRMPIVTEMIGSELGRPVEVDADPEHAVALGAAWHASSAMPEAPASVSPMPRAETPAEQPEAAATGVIPAAPRLPKAGFIGRAAVGAAAEPRNDVPPAAPLAKPVPLAEPAPLAKPARRWAPALAGTAAAVVLLLSAAGTAWALTRANAQDDTAAEAAVSHRQHGTPAPTGEKSAAVPADEQCTDQVKRSTRWVCLTKATLRDNKLTIWYQVDWNGTRPDIKKGFHLHIYGGDGTAPHESTMGSQAVRHSKYYFEDKQPSVRRTSDPDFEAVGDAKKVCARIAQSGHGLAKAYDGSYHTGNCVPIQRGWARANLRRRTAPSEDALPMRAARPGRQCGGVPAKVFTAPAPRIRSSSDSSRPAPSRTVEVAPRSEAPN